MTVLYLPWGIAEGENTQTHVQAKNIAERERGTDREGVLPDGCMVPALWIFFLAGHEARLSRKVPRDYQCKHHSAQHLTALKLPRAFHGCCISQDTTAVSLAWTMHFLAKHPEVQEKARREAEPCDDACPGSMQPLVELLACVPMTFWEPRETLTQQQRSLQDTTRILDKGTSRN